VVTPNVNEESLKERESTRTEKKRNTDYCPGTTDFEPLHIIALSITSMTLFLSYIYTLSYLYFQKFRLWCFMESFISCHHYG